MRYFGVFLTFGGMALLGRLGLIENDLVVVVDC